MCKYCLLLIIHLSVINSLFSQNDIYKNTIEYLSNDSKLKNELRYIVNKCYLNKKFIKDDTLQLSVSDEVIKININNFDNYKSDTLQKIIQNLNIISFNGNYNNRLTEFSINKESALRVYFTGINSHYLMGEIVLIKNMNTYFSYKGAKFHKWKRIVFFAIIEQNRVSDIFYKKRKKHNLLKDW